MKLALISMPWAIFNRPSIQLGTLKGYLRQQLDRVEVECCHPYLDIAATIGLDNYRIISESPWAAEALYCGLLFPEQKSKAEQVFQQTLKVKPALDYYELLPKLEEQLHNWLDQQNFNHCSLVGFSVCFSQLPPSLYAARAIKSKWPDIPIVFGGSTCTQALGSSLLSIFPEIDFIITGEGEQQLKELLLHLENTTPLSNANILTRQQEAISTAAHLKNQEIADLANLPLPDFDDYFLQMKKCSLDFIPVLPLEFSRGCWWNKCTFCNLNLQWQGYRHKKSNQILDEVKEMVQKYQCVDFTFTDNALPIREADLFFAATTG
jgi:hypothetical protein